LLLLLLLCSFDLCPSNMCLMTVHVCGVYFVFMSRFVTAV